MASGLFEINWGMDPPIKSGDDNEKGSEDDNFTMCSPNLSLSGLIPLRQGFGGQAG